MPTEPILDDDEFNAFFEAHRLFFTAPLLDQQAFASLYVTADEQAAIANYSKQLKAVLYKECIQVPIKAGMTQSYPLIYAWKKADFDLVLQNNALRHFLLAHRSHPAIEIWNHKTDAKERNEKSQLLLLTTYRTKLHQLERAATSLKELFDDTHLSSINKTLQHLQSMPPRDFSNQTVHDKEVTFQHLDIAIAQYQRCIEKSKGSEVKPLIEKTLQLKTMYLLLRKRIDDKHAKLLEKSLGHALALQTECLLHDEVTPTEISTSLAELDVQLKKHQLCIERAALLQSAEFNTQLAQLLTQIERLHHEKKYRAKDQAQALYNKLKEYQQAFTSGDCERAEFVKQCRSLIKKAKQSDLCQYTGIEKILNALAIILTLGLAAAFTGGFSVIHPKSMETQERLDETLNKINLSGG